MDIKSRAEALKKLNGNKQVSNKDLLFYIIGRVDDLEDKLELYDKEVTKIKTQVKLFWLVLPIALGLCYYLL